MRRSAPHSFVSIAANGANKTVDFCRAGVIKRYPWHDEASTSVSDLDDGSGRWYIAVSLNKLLKVQELAFESLSAVLRLTVLRWPSSVLPQR